MVEQKNGSQQSTADQERMKRRIMRRIIFTFSRDTLAYYHQDNNKDGDTGRRTTDNTGQIGIAVDKRNI